MIVTLYGENSFALQHELRQLVQTFTAEHGDLALERIDGQEAGFDQLQAALTSSPFLAAKKMVLLRAPGSNKQFTEKIEQLFNNLPETTDVIIVEPKLDKRQTYFKFLKKKTDFREFPPLDHNGLARWLVDEARRQSGTLSLADARYLTERVGDDQQLLYQEITKLVIHSPNITRQHIEALTDAAPHSTIFQLLDAAFAGDRRTVLDLYAEQRAQQVEPQQIIAMLTWQLHVLAIIKTAGDRSADTIAKDAKINPFVVRKSQGIARRLSQSEIKTLVDHLLAIDTKSKRTALNLDDALQHYLFDLAK